MLTLEIKAKNDVAADRWENIQSRQCILATFYNWTISVRQNPYDFTFTEVDVIRTWCEEGYKVELSLLQIVSEWINAVKTFPPTITGIYAFIRSPGQAAIATHKDGVTDAEKVESLPLHLDPSLDRQALPDPGQMRSFTLNYGRGSRRALNSSVALCFCVTSNRCDCAHPRSSKFCKGASSSQLGSRRPGDGIRVRR